MITRQKLYSVLRKAGWGTKNTSSRWPVVSADADRVSGRRWFTITYETYEGEYSIPAARRREAVHQMQAALSQAGIVSHTQETQLIVEG